MKTEADLEDIVKEVLDMYVGTQLNLDSELARGILASHIASELEMETRQPNDMDGNDLDTSTYTDDWSVDHVSDDFTL